MGVHISDSIDITNSSARYDESVKELLADKQVLARILKYSLEEFQDLELFEIMRSMSEPEISKIPVEPGLSNLGKIEKRSEEDSVKGEGKIFYDIRFVCRLGENWIKFLINVEAQKSTKVASLKYHLDNRIIFYLARMISAQKEVEFSKSDYDGIKAVRSIWICMDSNADEDSINRIRFVQENVYGKKMDLPNLDKVQGIIIRLRDKDDVEASKNYLIAMLEELLKKENAEKKKQKLVDDYGFIMSDETGRRINVMCNLSEVVLAQGIEKGIEQGLRIFIETMKDLKISKEETIQLLKAKYHLSEVEAENMVQMFWNN